MIFRVTTFRLEFNHERLLSVLHDSRHMRDSATGVVDRQIFRSLNVFRRIAFGPADRSANVASNRDSHSLESLPLVTP